MKGTLSMLLIVGLCLGTGPALVAQEEECPWEGTPWCPEKFKQQEDNGKECPHKQDDGEQWEKWFKQWEKWQKRVPRERRGEAPEQWQRWFKQVPGWHKEVRKVRIWATCPRCKKPLRITIGHGQPEFRKPALRLPQYQLWKRPEFKLLPEKLKNRIMERLRRLFQEEAPKFKERRKPCPRCPKQAPKFEKKRIYICPEAPKKAPGFEKEHKPCPKSLKQKKTKSCPKHNPERRY